MEDILLFSKINELGEQLIYDDSYKIFESGKEGVANYYLTCAIRDVYLSTAPPIGSFINFNK